MEKEHACGKNGYWKHFGGPYCRLFLDHENQFAPQSQIWLRDVRECLQATLVDKVDGLSCSQINSDARISHVGCYVETGFCELPWSQKLRIFWWLRKAWLTSGNLKEGEQLFKACKQPHLMSPMDSVDRGELPAL